MLLARVLGVLVALVLAVCVVLYVVTGNRKYLRLAWTVFKIALYLFVFALLLIFGERVVTQA
jgi:hypothetical protein